ncbi:hypothetical protein DFH09DRAFT_1114039 [Mycena vulgaris]|nr:hypothetical protein DFH09DRAFT_1114039 [Mycena vulgaris]
MSTGYQNPVQRSMISGHQVPVPKDTEQDSSVSPPLSVVAPDIIKPGSEGVPMDIDGRSVVPAPPVPAAIEPIETPMDVDSIPEISVVTTKERRKSSRLHVEMDPQPAPSVPDEVGVISTKPRKRKATRTSSTDTSKVKRIEGGVEISEDAEEQEDDLSEASAEEEDETEPPLIGLDWINDLSEISSPEQSSEYKLLYDVQNSMEAVRKRCTRNGVQFTQHVHGVDIRAPSAHESHLRVLQLSQWNAMSNLEKVQLWGTGVDLFIQDMISGPRIDHIREEVIKLHRLDAPVEVQGLRLRSRR